MKPEYPPIPVLRPMLPKARKLLPYLERIDETRIYSNWGPLVLELSERLGVLFGTTADRVMCANSGMSALVGAILATAGRASPAKSLAIVPDFTFTATGLAAQLCGYRVALADCRPDTWALDADALLQRPELLKDVGLVVPVAPFGRPAGVHQWERFHAATGIPVVIDGAACFELMLANRGADVGRLPMVLSFHATKSFGTGEGGCVVTADRELSARIGQALNFGFMNGRNSEISATNGKMSEYAAAVGLAELDDWDAKHASFLRVFGCYQQEFERLAIKAPLWGPPRISSGYILLECGSVEEAGRVMSALAVHRIDTRLWYGAGLAAHDIFRDAVRLKPHGEACLSPATIVGLPVAPDLEDAQVARICGAVAEALAG